MFSIRVSEAILNHGKRQVELHDFGKRFTANGTKEQQMTGIIGETQMDELFRLPWVDGANGFDGGLDIPFAKLALNVKTMGRTVDRLMPNYACNFCELQLYFKVDGYIFCSFNKLTYNLTVCGWCTKPELVERSIVRKPDEIVSRGSKNDTFKVASTLREIQIQHLRDVFSIEDLKNQLTTYSDLLNGECVETENFDNSVWYKA